MPEYQFAERNGKIVTEEYDKSAYFSSEQVFQSLQNAFGAFPIPASVSRVESYEDVFHVTYPSDDDFQEIYICAKGTTPGGRSGLKDEQRIQPKAKYINYVFTKQTQKQMMLRNCNLINECNPDFIAYGRSGFRGYIVFGFCKKNLFILESIFPNNATYIFESDWEGLSKLTKSEILNHNLQKGRLIHNANWPTEFEKYMNADG